jgi:hypothetical protein
MEISDDDLAACMRVLRAIEADRSHLTRFSREQRRELLTLAGLVAKPERHDLVRMAKAFRRAERQAAKEQDRKAIEQAGLRVQRRAAVFTPLWLEPPKPEESSERPRLSQERDCYVCKQPFTRVHRYYDSMCEPCGDFNYAKREQSADLSGHFALITGARVKIGYQASLKLLRAGAHVIVTTRFPVDAADRYTREADFSTFRARLQIHGLDLRHSPSVELFTKFLLERLPRLDYILNNACQTVRRPAGFFQHLLAREAQSIAGLPLEMQSMLAGHDELCRMLEGSNRQTPGALLAVPEQRRGEGLMHSAALSQRHYLDEDYRGGENPASALRAACATGSSSVTQPVSTAFMWMPSFTKSGALVRVIMFKAAFAMLVCGCLSVLVVR